MGETAICKAEGCDKKSYCRGFCQFHYDRDRRPSSKEIWRNYGKVKDHPLYHTYYTVRRSNGIKGKTVCDLWKKDFDQFVKDVGAKPSNNHRLLLKEGETEWKKDNVQWVEKRFIKRKYETSKEYNKEFQKHYRLTASERVKNCRLKLTYGIDINFYYEMLASQNHKCAICGKEETFYNRLGRKISLAVDHCHKTGKIRGLLCAHCNKSIGAFGESIDVLQSAIDYLKAHQ
jgi:hypothetical protein